jgi:hypothetical protein
MNVRGRGDVFSLFTLAFGACQGFAGTAAPSPSPSRATSYLEFRAGFAEALPDGCERVKGFE